MGSKSGAFRRCPPFLSVYCSSNALADYCCHWRFSSFDAPLGCRPLLPHQQEDSQQSANEHGYAYKDKRRLDRVNERLVNRLVQS